MLDRDRMIAQLLGMLSELGWKAPSGDVVDQIANGGLLTVAQAANICDTADQTIYRWIEDATIKGSRSAKSARHGCSAREGCSIMSRDIKAACPHV